MALKTPTIDSFLELLGKMGKGKFTIEGTCEIRYHGTGIQTCPIEYIAARSLHKKSDNYYGSVGYAAGLLGLNLVDRRELVMAADKSPGYDKNLRKRMLAAVGL